MQIVNHFRAKILHSSNAAFSLAIANSKYLTFAEKLISVKNEKAHCNLIKTHSDVKREILTNSKIYKYEQFLKNLSDIKPWYRPKDDLLNYRNVLPRLEVIKTNGNDHEYFLPYNNQAKRIIITAAKERLV